MEQKQHQEFCQLQDRVFYAGREANLTVYERLLMILFGDDRYEELMTMTPEEITTEHARWNKLNSMVNAGGVWKEDLMSLPSSEISE